MKRTVKEAISVIVLISSTVTLLLGVRGEAAAPGQINLAMIMISAPIVLISVFVIIMLSKTGLRIEGSEDEWAIATILDPKMVIYRRRMDKEQERTNDKTEPKMNETCRHQKLN